MKEELRCPVELRKVRGWPPGVKATLCKRSRSHQSPVTSHQSPVTSHQSPVTSRQSSVVTARVRRRMVRWFCRPSMFAIFALEVLDQASQHPGDFRITFAKVLAFSVVEMPSSFCHGQVRAGFFRRPAREVQVVGEMTVGLLLESLCNERRHAGGGSAQLFTQSQIFCKHGAVDDRRNCVGGRERLPVHEQFVECSNDHAEHPAIHAPGLIGLGTGDWGLETT
jgi:hypothetical protein